MKLQQRRELLLEVVRAKPQTDVCVARVRVGPSMIELFREATSSLYTTAPFVKFEGERATDLDGLTRELFSLFWVYARHEYFEGASEVVPRVDPQTCRIDVFTVLGRIISYGYLITGYIPVFMAKASVISSICRQTSISDDVILSSFLNYIDGFEKECACRMMKGQMEDDDFYKILGMLSRFKCFVVPSSDNIRQHMIECAHSELIYRPTHALSSIARGMREAHPGLRDHVDPDCIADLYQCLIPTCMKVWNLIKPPGTMNMQQDGTLDYLRRFVFSLMKDELALMMRFVTGSESITGTGITVTFCGTEEGLARHPSSHTCTGTLQLPTTYKSYSDFRREFLNVLKNNELWFMDQT